MKAEDIKKAAEESLYFFATLVNPGRAYGDIHKRVFRFLEDNRFDQLILLPRGHQKSHCIAMWTVWWITKYPETTCLYISATEDLATEQLYFIKSVLEGDVYNRYWPDMINDQEGNRNEWNYKNIKIDHPRRNELGVRDRTVAARSVGANTTGLHCDVLVFDDLVVPDNAYSQEGRRKVQSSYSQFSSVLNPGGITKAVGTRYHGKDIYGNMMEAMVEEMDDNGVVLGEHLMYKTMEEQVETEGVFLWPRQKHPKTGRWHGFDWQQLNKIKAKYFAAGERAQYAGQYYNNPNDPDSDKIGLDNFQYFDRKHLTNEDGLWYINGKYLETFCGCDLAFTDSSSSDYTAMAVIGIDCDGFLYILELDQFKTTKYEKMYRSIERLHNKWKFKRARLETNAGANLVAEYMKDRIREEGMSFVIEGKPAKGEKTERHQAILEPRYENNSVFHYTGGLTSVYEEEVVLARPANDDLLDAVCGALEISRVPKKNRGDSSMSRGKVIGIDGRFGGRIR